MKDKHKTEKIPPRSEKSLTVSIQQVARLLRTEVERTTTLELKEREAKILSLKALGPSMSNSVDQVAKLLRSQIQKAKTVKKRIYISRSPRKTKTATSKKGKCNS